MDGFTLDAWVYSIRRGYVRVVSGLPVAKESWIRGSRSPERRDHRYRGQLHVDGPRSSDAVQTAVPQEMAPQRGGEGDPLGCGMWTSENAPQHEASPRLASQTPSRMSC